MLRQRVITALILGLPLLAILLLAPASWILPVLTLVMLLGAWEWSGFFVHHQAIRLLYAALFAVLMLASYLMPQRVDAQLVLVVAMCWWLLAACWIVFAPQAGSRWLIALTGLLVLFPMWIALQMLAGQQRGGELILCLLLIVTATDIGAYFTGRTFGKHKLAPLVSPGKTWEGVAGGLLATMLIAAIASRWFGMPLVFCAMLVLLTAMFSIVGDLTESLCKRQAGVKDSSQLLPGHGGVLDRIDSLTAAAPVFVYGLMYLHVVTV